MNLEDKKHISILLTEYCKQFSSVKEAAKKLDSISSVDINNIINNKWDKLTDDFLENISQQIISLNDHKWKIVETRDFRLLSQLLQDAKKHANVFAVTGEAGIGKSFIIKHFANAQQNTFQLSCNDYWNRNLFLKELLSVLGKEVNGGTVGEMMSVVIKTLRSMPNPIIIMDEADKLSDQVLYFFITLYNVLEEKCGIILVSTNHLEKRIIRGLKLNKKGYKEVYSRIGRKFIELKGPNPKDIKSICIANGINEELAITEIINSSEKDLRRVKRQIHAMQMQRIFLDNI